MKNDALEWSPAYRLFDTEHHLGVSGKPGVYRIRAFTDKEPLPIPRANGVDPAGILHIGKSTDLGKRLGQFRRAAESGQARHHAGREYANWDFERLVPLEQLRFDYLLTDDEREALDLERKLHEAYRLAYLDRPPLDGTSGRLAK
jgi:hypothetical protein